MKNDEENINYVQINQEMKNKAIEKKSEMDPNIFIKFW